MLLEVYGNVRAGDREELGFKEACAWRKTKTTIDTHKGQPRGTRGEGTIQVWCSKSCEGVSVEQH